jgi:hypothetical protein
MRITLPSFDGLSPRSDERIAFSISFIVDGSNGCATMSAGSGTDSDATWLMGIFDPYASTWTPSSRLVVARPVRTAAISRRTRSMAPSMRAFTSPNMPFKSLKSIISR